MSDVVGSWVVFDPTGRDMLECMVVGHVLEVTWEKEDDGDPRGYPRPILKVTSNGDNEVYAVTSVRAVVAVQIRSEHERGWDAGYDAAIHDARVKGSRAHSELMDVVVGAQEL